MRSGDTTRPAAARRPLASAQSSSRVRASSRSGSCRLSALAASTTVDHSCAWKGSKRPSSSCKASAARSKISFDSTASRLKATMGSVAASSSVVRPTHSTRCSPWASLQASEQYNSPQQSPQGTTLVRSSPPTIWSWTSRRVRPTGICTSKKDRHRPQHNTSCRDLTSCIATNGRSSTITSPARKARSANRPRPWTVDGPTRAATQVFISSAAEKATSPGDEG
mmetsp:Transcript_17194/g.55796  ORF Transcript_17194/g.55796 Transcript_17194/m.55796 type:complete len:223 (+) Transcript_17194:946-1614(+)